MTHRLRLVLALHNHQPVGNFEGVCESAYQDSYLPLLDVLEDFPDIPISLHNSGSLLEWLVSAHPEYIDRVRQFVDRGQIEIIGGPFYEPILACIPSRDRIGQITAYSRYLEQLFGGRVRGMWVPERVWEQSFTDDICRAGIEYTILDDFHFKSAGLKEEELHGYFLTEDEGRLLKIFPGSERLRYTIPFADPLATIDYLRSVHAKHPGAVVTFGDDGEKFGTWPGTKKHVYDDGWLRKFFQTLNEHRDWLQVSLASEAIDNTPPAGKVYLPDASYREMTEWALTTERQIEHKQLVERFKMQADLQQHVHVLKGGFWRNFRVKYPEANEMYCRMLQISQRLEDLQGSAAAGEHPDLIRLARTELYRAQCNCSYWHGAFGGLYLPHLRNAVYRHLISADTLLESVMGRTGRWAQVEAGDFNLDARKEVRISSDRFVAFFNPARGGHLYEFDIRSLRHNLLATLDRRPEPYHETVRRVGNEQSHHEGEVASIHDMVSFKQPHLDKKLIYDHVPRKSLVDHFLQPGLGVDAFSRGEGEIGDFTQGVYETRLRRGEGRVELAMSREGKIGEHRGRLTKYVTLEVSSGGSLQIRYVLEDLPPGAAIHFGVELNFAGMPTNLSDRFYYDSRGQNLGQLQTVQNLKSADRIGLVDEWLGLDASVDLSTPGDIWTFPIQTVSQSESGFELVHQSCAVVPHWEFVVPESGRWSVDLTLSIDTSAAQARELHEATATAMA